MCPFSIIFSSTQKNAKFFLKWWATWTFLPQQFLKYNAHSLSSFKSNCISKSRACKNDPVQEEKFFNFWGEKGKEGGITLLLFTNWTQKNPKQTNNKKGKWKSDYTRFSASDCLICCYKDSLKILYQNLCSQKLCSSLCEITRHLETLERLTAAGDFWLYFFSKADLWLRVAAKMLEFLCGFLY